MALCERLGLAPVRDPTNDDPRFVRNRVRHELLPLCSAIAGRDVVPVLARQAGLLAGDADILDAVASLIDPRTPPRWPRRPRPVGRRSVRDWLTGDGPYPPPLDAVERVLEVATKQRRATEVAGRSAGATAGRPALAHRPDHSEPGSDGYGAPVQSGR